MSRSDLGDVTPNNLGQVRVLHKVLFPVSYGDNFYNELLEADEFAKLGTQKEKKVKWILSTYTSTHSSLLQRCLRRYCLLS